MPQEPSKTVRKINGVVRAVIPYSPASWYTSGTYAGMPIPIPCVVVATDDCEHYFPCAGETVHINDEVYVLFEWVSVFGIKWLSYWGVTGFEKAAA